jgi:hypothetical protein
MQSKLKFAAYCAVNMIQNMNGAVTASDVKRISYAWQLTVHRNPSKKLLFTESDLFFVLGTGDDMCKVMWSVRSGDNNGSAVPPNSSPYNVQSGVGSALSTAYSCIFRLNPARIKTEIASTILHPNLHIKAGEKKMILEIRYYIWNSNKLTPRELFGFRILNPGYVRGTDGKILFDTVVIFTPKPGLFDETPPG